MSYCFGGGEWGNRPAGAVSELIGALPRISQVENLTPMSGGTGRFSRRRWTRWAAGICATGTGRREPGILRRSWPRTFPRPGM